MTPPPDTLTRYDIFVKGYAEDGVLYTDHLDALTAERARAERAEQERNTAIAAIRAAEDNISRALARADRDATARQEAERVSESRRDQLLKCSDERRAEWIRAENAEAALAARRP